MVEARDLHPRVEGSDPARDLEIHVLDQVLQIGLVLLRRERERLAVGNVQVHSVLQRGGAPYPRHF